MGYWSVLVPEAGSQLISNPSIETNTTGWTLVGSALTRLTTGGAFGYCCLEINTDNAAANEGAYYTVNPDDTAAAHMASIYVWGAAAGGTVRIRLRDQTNGTESSSAAVTLTTTPVRISVSHTTGAASADLRLYVETNVQQNLTFKADAAMIQKVSYLTTYIDGAQTGCSWNGTVHASTSERSAQSRAGGRWRDLYDDYSVGVVGMLGFGMPELKHNVTPYSILPGALLQSIKTEPRQFTLILEPAGGSLSTLHTRRDSLVDAFKPDLVTPLQPVRLKYSGGTQEVEIAAYYAGGLEGSIVGDEGVKERMAVRFVAYDPYFTLGRDSSASLTAKQSVANTNYIIKKRNGVWSALVAGAGAQALVFAEGPDGSIYVGGAFTNLGDANGDYIVKYDPVNDTWTSLGVAALNNQVRAIAIGPSGIVYVGGLFTNAGGDANADFLAQWNGTAWSAVAAGANGQVEALVFDQSGNLYIAGNFIDWGDANGDYIVKWNGTALSSLSTGLTNTANILAVGLDGNIYVGGVFTNVGDANGDYIVKWNGTAFSSLGSGMNAAVSELAVAPNGDLYAGGEFTTAGGVSANRIAKWNGTVWSALGTGVNNTVYALDIAESGIVYVGGIFTSAGGVSLADRLALWNGSTWVHPDINIPGSARVDALLETNGDLYLGYDVVGPDVTSAVTTVTNSGSTVAYPKLTIKRSGGTSATIEWLKNETTGATCWFNYGLQDGETVTIDFTPGNKTITSDFRGNVIGAALLPGSDFSTWALQPGSNDISLFVNDAGTPTITASMVYRESYWSPDGA